LAPASEQRFLAPFGQIEGEGKQRLRGLARDLERFTRRVRPDIPFGLRKEQPFGVFAHHDKIHRLVPWDLDRRDFGRGHPHGSDPGKQLEGLAHLHLGGDFRAVGVAHIRQAHRRQENCIRVARRFQRCLGQAFARFKKMRSPGRKAVKAELIAARLLCQTSEDFDSRANDFGTNTIPFKDRDCEFPEHGVSFSRGVGSVIA